MELNFEVTANIRKPVGDVFDAVYDPGKLSQYFTTNPQPLPLDGGTAVTWEFAGHPGSYPVKVVETLRDRSILLEWSSSGNGKSSLVELRFDSREPENTTVRIAVTGELDAQNSPADDYMKCQGWMLLAFRLKAWLEGENRR